MGSTSSKPNAAESQSSSTSSPESGRRRSRSSKGSRVFQSSCLGPPPGSHDSDESDDDEQVSEQQSQEIGCSDPSTSQVRLDADQVKAKCDGKVKSEQPDATAGIPSCTEYDEVDQSVLSNSVALSSRSLSRSSRFLSRFGLFPSNTSFKLSRATSLGSSQAYSVSATSFSVSNEGDQLVSNEGDQLDPHAGPSLGLVNRYEPSRGRNFLPGCLVTRSPPPQLDDFASSSLDSNPTTSAFFDNLRDVHNASSLNVATDVENRRGESNVNSRSSRNDVIESTRTGDRHMERNVRFSRTLSVGRLRDRVLRRSTFPDFPFSSLEQEREVRDASHQGGTQAMGGGTGASNSNGSALISSNSVRASTGRPSSFYNSQDSEVEIFRARETRYRDLLEHRSNFLERRRRIRSQVHALQRLGSRFENLSGHERSCIISGQHRTGNCTCPIGIRVSNTSDDTTARASISRIVMLAEALFEVLDEIHQQSVVIFPSVSSTGSVPAPNEVVEALPVKLVSKKQKHLCEEAAQCYICLVEYEEGDSVRILPCHHEFHRSCVDKWLKEIHRVCPLCRGDICIPDPVLSAN